MLTTRYVGCVYLATCLTNGKIYIGKSIYGLEWRRRTHERYAKSGTVLFLYAIKKYGAPAFQWSELFCSDDDRALMAAETDLISDYREAGYTLYNMTNGGDGCAGRVVSASQLEKMRRPRSEAAKAAIRASQTPEVLAAKAKAMRNRIVSEASRKKLSEARKGMKFSAEHRANMAKSRTGIKMAPWTPERRAKMEAAWERRRLLGISKPSDETRKRQSEAAKKRRPKTPQSESC